MSGLSMSVCQSPACWMMQVAAHQTCSMAKEMRCQRSILKGVIANTEEGHAFVQGAIKVPDRVRVDAFNL
jgi:hypothetical protein